MSQVDHVQDIAFSTAFLTDKICGVYTGTFEGTNTTVLNPGGFIYQYIIPHTFGRPVMCDTLVSIDGGTTFDPLTAITYSDSSNIYINILNTTKTYIYKVVCTWIDNYDTTDPLVTPVLQTTDSAYFDSRHNYQKILASGTLTLHGGTGLTQVPYDNSGHFSNFRVYFESEPGQVWPAIWGGSQDPWLNDPTTQGEIAAYIDDSTLWLVYTGSSATTFRVWYKIYYEF